jgi:hypothetical protein
MCVAVDDKQVAALHSLHLPFEDVRSCAGYSCQLLEADSFAAMPANAATAAADSYSCAIHNATAWPAQTTMTVNQPSACLH